MKLRILVAASLAFAATDLSAKTDESRWCRTKPGTVQTEYMIKEHERHEKILRQRGQTLRQQHINTDIGEIAVIEGSPSTIVEPNAFDLEGKKIFFDETSPSKYRLRVRGGSVSGTQGSAIDLNDDDSQQVNFTSGFRFPFFGTTYTSV